MNKNPGRLGEPWSATCTSAVDGEIHWNIYSKYENVDFTNTLRFQKCNGRKCRRRIIQWQVPSQRTFVSRLEIDHLEFDDLGEYTCRILVPGRGDPLLTSYRSVLLNYSSRFEKLCKEDISDIVPNPLNTSKPFTWVP
ncbi:hypothetical protein ElyMa_004976500 [Elysia marginata]|uniref:Ig-like domain-containing protein n=1 Tax=Elysia marginata TaxID=1093978 RepID=A0AAV4J398_9GAST|nr:hypothetical protein ElyMa_004976500 [Elysia marginata]